MTSDALTTTTTELPALMPSSSTDSLVVEEVTIWPLPISTRTCEVVAPFLTSMTVPLIWLRALIRMMGPHRIYGARGVACASVAAGPPSPRACGATIPDISACSGQVESASLHRRLRLGVRSGQHLAAGGRQLRQRHRRFWLWRLFRRLRVDNRILEPIG